MFCLPFSTLFYSFLQKAFGIIVGQSSAVHDYVRSSHLAPYERTVLPQVKNTTAMILRPRFRALALSIVLTLALAASGCSVGTDTTESSYDFASVDHEAEYLGREVSAADLIWIEPINSEDLDDTLRYREILNLEAFVGRSPVPVLLILRNTLDGSGPGLIPMAENLAMDVRDRARIVFVDYFYEDGYLDLLSDLAAPSFHLIHEGSLLEQAEGIDNGAIENIIKHLYDIIDEEI